MTSSARVLAGPGGAACGVALLRVLAAGGLALLAVLGTNLATATPLTPELQKQVRAATFEVVLKKPEKDPLTYEKPLPLELIPFQERNDKYRSVGTAFAISPTSFATAAHVIAVAVASQWGAPCIRDSAGQVYPIERVVRYSSHEDFVEFTVVGAPPMVPLTTNTTPALDDPVLAVGNALGEGVIIRDGLLTSMTPEAKEGRWKWLRFSAAASPGNSGGPLLDSQGRVIGIVARKSPNENLNYALPIDRLLSASDKFGTFEGRESFGIPKLLQGTIVADYKDTFALPQSFPEFSRTIRAVLLKFYKEQHAKLLTAEADSIFPRGQSGKLLATLYAAFDPLLMAQEEDKSWDANACSGGSETRLPGDGRVWSCGGTAAGVLFRIQYAGNAADEHRYHDSKHFMDLILKALPLPREVGTQPVRVTSLGPATEEAVVRDRYGRPWQRRIYAIGYADMYLVAMALPTPDGYVGMLSLVPSGLLEVQVVGVEYLANYFYVSYAGSLPQWQAFLQGHELRPAVFERTRMQFEDGKGLRFESPRLRFDSSGIAAVGAQSSLELRMTYMMDRGQITWDIGGIEFKPDRDKKGFVAAYRQAKPSEDAGKDLNGRWEHMSREDGEFAGNVQHDSDLTDFWIRTVARREGAPGIDATHAQYELVYNIDKALLPRETADLKSKLTESFKVME
ncbi:MAG: trypsin-like peptidase domain-containing protein [Proteobacteria bacterium]|nr:trypsin-like peptidase domain-containing protein [Pseudomonadota bacterium]